MKGRKPHATAAIEALQEAGLLGKIEKKKLGSYHYRKRLKNGAALLLRVDVFPLRVVRQRKSWPKRINARPNGSLRKKPPNWFTSRSYRS